MSELTFLLVENYNNDHSFWSPDRLGIFGYYNFFQEEFHLFINRFPSWKVLEKSS